MEALEKVLKCDGNQDVFFANIVQAKAELAAREAERAEMISLCYKLDEENAICPCCWNITGHADDCKLAAMLKKLEHEN